MAIPRATLIHQLVFTYNHSSRDCQYKLVDIVILKQWLLHRGYTLKEAVLCGLTIIKHNKTGRVFLSNSKQAESANPVRR